MIKRSHTKVKTVWADLPGEGDRIWNNRLEVGAFGLRRLLLF